MCRRFYGGVQAIIDLGRPELVLASLSDSGLYNKLVAPLPGSERVR